MPQLRLASGLEVDSPFTWVVADSTARTALTLTAIEVTERPYFQNKLCLQLSDYTIWGLSDYTNMTWSEVSKAPTVPERKASMVVAPSKTVTAQKVVEMVSGGVSNYPGIVTDVITPDSVVALNNIGSSYIDCVELTSSKILVVFRGASNYGTAVVLDIAGTTITYGTPVTFKSLNCEYNVVAKLSSTKAVVAYTNSDVIKSVVLTITGSTIVVGTESPMVANGSINKMTLLAENKVILNYNSSGTGTVSVSILNILNDIITPSASALVMALSTYIGYYSHCTLSNNKFLWVYCDNTNSYIRAKVVTVNVGDTITVGADNLLVSLGSSSLDLSAISSTKVLMVSSNGTTNKVNVLTVTGDTVTCGTAYSVASADSRPVITSITSTKALLSYRTYGSPYAGRAVILNIADTTITANSVATVTTGGGVQKIVVLSESIQLWIFPNASTQYLSASILRRGFTSTNILGVSLQSKVAGELAIISYEDEIDGFSNLVQGSLYYLSDSGDLSTSPSPTHEKAIAIALSSTKIKWFGSSDLSNSKIYLNVSAPSTATVGRVGDIRVDTNKNIWTLKYIETGLYYWSPDGFPAMGNVYFDYYSPHWVKKIYKYKSSAIQLSATINSVVTINTAHGISSIAGFVDGSFNWISSTTLQTSQRYAAATTSVSASVGTTNMTITQLWSSTLASYYGYFEFRFFY